MDNAIVYIRRQEQVGRSSVRTSGGTGADMNWPAHGKKETRERQQESGSRNRTHTHAHVWLLRWWSTMTTPASDGAIALFLFWNRRPLALQPQVTPAVLAHITGWKGPPFNTPLEKVYKYVIQGLNSPI
jgi:hypothetical protein